MPRRLTGAAAEFVARKYGGDMQDAVAVESVGTTGAEVLRNDPERVFALLVNLSVNTIYVGFDAQAGSARGIVLAPSGGTYQVDVEEDLMIPTYGMFALATAASSNLYVMSVRRITRHEPGTV